MAQNEDLTSDNNWAWNCPPGKNDLDYLANWQNRPNGRLEIIRHNLIGIKYSMKCWNEIDGWIEKNGQHLLDSPVESYTFYPVSLSKAFALRVAENYWGKKYKIETKLTLMYGDPPGEIYENVLTKTNGCFSKLDPYFIDVHGGCFPPEIICE